MNRASLALLLSLSWTAACGARSELIVRDPDAAAVTPSFPPGCQWQLGERRTIATDIDRPAANVGALSTVFGFASSHVVAAWNLVDSRAGERTSQYRVLSLQLDFEGRQLGATQTLFSMVEPNLLLGVLTPPQFARTSRGFAMLALRGNTGCSVVRMDPTRALLSVSASFVPGGLRR